MRTRKALISASALSLLVMSNPAQAAKLLFEIEWGNRAVFGGEDYVGPQSFTIDTTAGFSGGLEGYLYFTTIDDSLGRDTVFFGNSDRNGQTGTGLIDENLTVPSGNRDFFSTPIWSGTGTTLNVAAGDSFTGNRGSVIRVSSAPAIPEPGTWAMMLLGFGLVGGALRAAKRRQNVTVSYV